MANWIKVTLKQTYKGVLCMADFDYRLTDDPTVSDLIDLLGTMDDAWLTAINGIQHDSVRNQGISATWRGNAAVTYETSLDGGGTYAAAADLLPLPQQSFYFRRYVGTSHEWDGGELVTARPIAKGALFLVGITDDWATDGDPDVPSGLADELASFLAFQTFTFTIGDLDYVPVVHGYALPAASPLPARPEVYADIESVSFRRPSWRRDRHI